MKKFFAVLISFLSLVVLLTSCKTTNPSCVLELTSTDSSVSYSMIFTDLDEKQSNYKIELLKQDSVVKSEESSVSITAGSFTGLDLNSLYKINVYVTDKSPYDLRLATKEISTEKGNLTGITFNSQTFIYDGKEKSIEVSNLPAGATVSYTGNGVINVGEHLVTAIVQKDNYKDLTLTAQLTITPQILSFELTDKTVIYNGKPHFLEATTEVELSYEYYQGNIKLEEAPIHAGTYMVKAIYAGDENHKRVEKNATLTIEKASIDMSGVRFENASFPYDGQEHELKITGTLPEGVTVTYENNKLTNAGSMSAKAIFNVIDPKNYNEIEAKEAILTIEKANVTLTASDVQVSLGDPIQIPYECDLPHATISIKLYDMENNEIETPMKTGNYYAILSFAGDENHNRKEIRINIKVTNPSFQDVTITLNKIDITYGQSYDVLPIANHGVVLGSENIAYYQGTTRLSQKPVNAGEYTIVVTYAGDEEKFLNPAFISVDLIIHKITIDMSGVGFSDLTVTYDGQEHELKITGTLPEGVSVTYEYNKLTNASSTQAVAKFSYIDTLNYDLIPNMTATLTIEKANPSLEGIQKSFSGAYQPGMTLEEFKDKLNAQNFYVSNYGIILTSGNNSITATFDLGDSNYLTVEVEITVNCIAQLIGYEVEEEGHQILGREFDTTNIKVYLIYNDGSRKLAEDKDFTIVETTIDTTSVFTITIQLNKGSEGQFENKTAEITPIETPEVMIYAVYSAGGNSGATYKNDFIILYNASNKDIDLTGWSIQQAAGNTSSNNTISNVGMLSGSIKAYGFYIILGAGGNNGVELPFASDVNCVLSNINPGANNFQLFLSTTSKKLIPSLYANGNYVDMIGVGSATNAEGAAAPAIDKGSYVKRNSLKDTNNNALDFEKIAFTDASEFAYLAEGHEAYNYAKTVIDTQNLDFNNLPDTFKLPMQFNGVNIQWTMPEDVAQCLKMTADGTVTVSKTTNCDGKLIGKIDGYSLGFEYSIFISNKTRLETPKVTLSHFTLSWGAVDNAEAYSIYINGTFYKTITETVYNLYDNAFNTNFSQPDIYNITILANCAEGSSSFADSAASIAVHLNYVDTGNLSSLSGENFYTIKAVVTLKGSGAKNNFYVRDLNSEQGFLIYNYSGEEGNAFFTSIQPGQVIYITGKYSEYRNSPQIQNITGSTITSEIADIPSITESCVLSYADIARPISLEGIVMSKFENNLLKVACGENTFFLYPSADYVADVTTLQGLLPGNTLSFVGAVGRFNDTIQIYLTGYTVTSTDVSHDYKLEVSLVEAADKIKSSYLSEETITDLLLTGTSYAEVVISYVVTEGTEHVTIADSSLTFGVVEEATSIKVQITVTIGAVSKTLDKNIILKPVGAKEEKTITLKSTVTGAAANMDSGTSDKNSTLVGDTEGLFNITSTKNSASNQVGVNKDGTVRLYANAASGNGTSLTITGKTTIITKVIITYKAASSTCDVEMNGTKINISNSYTTKEISILDNSFYIKNVNTVNVQVYIQSIQIFYTVN